MKRELLEKAAKAAGLTIKPAAEIGWAADIVGSIIEVKLLDLDLPIGTKLYAAAPVAEQDKPVAWHNPRADKLRSALRDIADTKNLTATPQQFARALQRMACDALTSDAMDEPPPVAEVPALPDAAFWVWYDDTPYQPGCCSGQEAYTAGQMGDYALAAIAADRAARPVLTDEQIDNLWIRRDCIEAIQQGDIIGQVRSFARAIEKVLRTKT